MFTLRIAVFLLGILFCLTPWATPPIALAIGIVIALTLGHPWPAANSKATRLLLQASVVGLGFGINLHQVIAAGRIGLAFTVVSIVGTVAIGYAIGKVLRVRTTTAHLISAGTAICGGSAIAAVGPVVHASDEEMSVSLATVFVLNAVSYVGVLGALAMLRLPHEPIAPTSSVLGSVVEGLLGDSGLAPGIRRLITEAAEGNPLFVEQLVGGAEQLVGRVELVRPRQAAGRAGAAHVGEDLAGGHRDGQVAAGQRDVVGEPLEQPQRHRGDRRPHRDVGGLVAHHDLGAVVSESLEHPGVDQDVRRRVRVAGPVDGRGHRGDRVVGAGLDVGGEIRHALLGPSLAYFLLVAGLALLASRRMRLEWPERLVFAFSISYAWIFVLSVLVPLFGWTAEEVEPETD